jgi:hypothetical protein
MEGREEEFKLLTEHKARGPASEPSCRRGPARLKTKDRVQVKEAAAEAKRREAESQEHLAAARDAMERQHELQAELLRQMAALRAVGGGPTLHVVVERANNLPKVQPPKGASSRPPEAGRRGLLACRRSRSGPVRRS